MVDFRKPGHIFVAIHIRNYMYVSTEHAISVKQCTNTCYNEIYTL